MSLVKPILPSHILKLIGDPAQTIHCQWWQENARLQQIEFWRNAAYELDQESSKLQFARDLQTQKSALLESFLKDSTNTQDTGRRYFACLIIESLYLLRVHNALAARNSYKQAEDFYRRNLSLLSKLEALESLGLLNFLLAELENKLSSYKCCF